MVVEVKKEQICSTCLPSSYSADWNKNSWEKSAPSPQYCTVTVQGCCSTPLTGCRDLSHLSPTLTPQVWGCKGVTRESHLSTP